MWNLNVFIRRYPCWWKDRSGVCLHAMDMKSTNEPWRCASGIWRLSWMVQKKSFLQESLKWLSWMFLDVFKWERSGWWKEYCPDTFVLTSDVWSGPKMPLMEEQRMWNLSLSSSWKKEQTEHCSISFTLNVNGRRHQEVFSKPRASFKKLSKRNCASMKIKNWLLQFTLVVKYFSEPVLSYFCLSNGTETVLLLLLQSFFFWNPSVCTWLQ